MKRRGIRDERVLAAISKVPRHEFVWMVDSTAAYSDHPLRIGHGQTISQPYMVAIMTELLELSGGERVLEIGTGSGYSTAVLCELAKAVFSIERISELHEYSKNCLAPFGYANLSLFVGDGTLGLPSEAPFDRIIVAAGAPHVPDVLFEQLTEGGRMVIPVGDRNAQNLKVIEKHNGKMVTTDDLVCIFVPLIGEKGWQSPY